MRLHFKGVDVFFNDQQVTTDWASAIKQVVEERKDNIRLVALMQNRWTDGSWIDLDTLLPEIKTVCCNAVVVLDMTQSLGVVPISVETLDNTDFLVASTHKWLLGLYGLAVMWVNPNGEGKARMT